MQHLPDNLELELHGGSHVLPVRLQWRRWKHIGRNQKEAEFVWRSADAMWTEVGTHFRLFGHYKKHYGGLKVGFEHLFVVKGFCKDESLASCMRLPEEALGRVGSEAVEAVPAVPESVPESVPEAVPESVEAVEAVPEAVPESVEAVEAVPECAATPCSCAYPTLAFLPTTLRVRYVFPGVHGTGRLYRTAENELLLHRWDIEPLSLLSTRVPNILESLFVNDVSLKTILETYTERQIRELDVYVLGASLPERLASLKDSLVHKKEMLRQLEKIAALQAEHDRVEEAIRALQRA
jgi:hypothetical protein